MTMPHLTITVVGLALPGIVSGTIVVEYAFTYQGLGYLTLTALGGCVPTEDMQCGGGGVIDCGPLVGLLVLLVVVVSLANMLADVMYVVADPRVENAGAERKARGE